jgi:tetratricopeptide (TPR) repeat protein
LKEDGELELEYELLADTCKGFVTLQDYLEYYSTRDSFLMENDYTVQNIDQLPLDPKNPKHRHFEIQYIVININDKDTTQRFSYGSVFNENGQWKVIWTLNISQAAGKLMSSQKFSDAIQAYREVLKYDPLNGSAYKQIGWCQSMQGYQQDALTNAQKAVELNPKDESNYNLLAGIYSIQDNDELAVENYKKAIDMTNSDAQKVYLLSNLSISYLNLYKYDKAKQAINRALKIDSTHTHAWWRKGIMFTKESKRDSAITCFQKAVTHKPMDDFLQHQLYYDLAYQEYISAAYDTEDKEMRENLLVDAKNHILKALDLQHDNNLYRRLLDDINRIK